MQPNVSALLTEVTGKVRRKLKSLCLKFGLHTFTVELTLRSSSKGRNRYAY